MGGFALRPREGLPPHDVFADRNGVWCCRPYLGRTPGGRKIRPYRSFPSARTREEAQALADTWVASLTADGRVASSLVRDLLREYVDMRERGGAAPNTVRAWRMFCDNYVCPLVGSRPARDLTAIDLMRMEADLLREGGSGGAPLSRNTVRDVHQFLRGAWSHLVDAGVLDSNPMLLVRAPARDSSEAVALGEWDFGALGQALSGALRLDPAEGAALRDVAPAMCAWLALHAGLRVGEACGLRRRDVVRSGGWLHVGGTVVEGRGGAWRQDATKGKRSRNVSLAPGEMAVVEAWLRLVDARLGRGLGPGAPLVTADGRVMRPSSVSRAFGRLARSLGLPDGVRFHSLRHTHATWLLMAGVDVKTVSERLGHADVATTLRYYGHVLPGRDRAAAEAFERRAGELGA